MSRTIKCTNPACEAFIPVPDEATQVICSQCNTWHPISADQFDGGSNDQGGFGAYEPPPAPNDPYTGFDDQGIAPPIDLPDTRAGGMDYFDDPVTPAEPAPNNATLAYLLTDTGVKLLLRAGQNIIGRKNTDLVIDDKTISRRHCVVEIMTNNTGEWESFIYDIGHQDGKPSTNGVYVSGRTLRLQDYERVPIRNGTAIRLGNVNLTFRSNY